MHALLVLAILPDAAEAADLSWTCTSVNAPADVVAWRLATPASDEELGAAQAGREAFDALYARVDAECLADCVMPFADACPERTCVTVAGDIVTWSTEETGFGVVSIHLAVEPDPGAGLGWTRAEVTRSRSSDLWTTWRVTWDGILDTRWPADGAFEASVTDPGSSRTRESWSDATCRWATETGWVESPPSVHTEGWHVDMNDVSVVVTNPYSVSLCGVSPAELGGVPATLDGNSVGLVDVDTWRALDGTDTDGDHWLAEHGDCDDTNSTINCEAYDIAYDGVDQDCAGGDNVDADHDGVRGDDGTDCDDGSATIHPGAADRPGDGLDQDCDGTDGTDADGDGFTATFPGRRPRATDDCDDADPSAYPGAPETWRDGIDQDCDGTDGTRALDADRDRWADDEDCAPEDPNVHAGVAEAVDEDGVDSNCDGVDGPDSDHDGVADAADCAPDDASIHPGATDTPDDGIDQDCDGTDTHGDTSTHAGDTSSRWGCVTAGQAGSSAWGGGHAAAVGPEGASSGERGEGAFAGRRRGAMLRERPPPPPEVGIQCRPRGGSPLRNASPSVVLASLLAGVVLRARRRSTSN